MEEIRGTPTRRLSQILDPITRLTSELGSSSSAPCSPRLVSRHHETCCTTSSGPSSLGLESTRIPGPDSPRLMPRRGRQGPTPPPRPRNNNSPVHYRDSPYVNVSNLIFQKDKSFAESAKSAGYVELKDSSGCGGSGPSSLQSTSSKAKVSPFNFTSESSGHVEYVDSRSYMSQLAMDFVPTPTCYENKPHEVPAYPCGRSPFEPSTSRSPFERSYSVSGRQQPESQSRQDVAKEPKSMYGSSKSFDGYSNTVEELNWQERCLELQLELHRSRNQASRVRDMLREKVSRLDSSFFCMPFD